MPITLTPCLDINGVIDLNANTYATLAEADAYFAERPNATTWTAETDDEKRKSYLLWAMKSLKGLGWIGGPFSQAQPLDWPRVAIRPVERSSSRTGRTGYETIFAFGSGGLYDGNGYFHEVTTIPQGVKNAQFEFAFAIQQSTVLTTPEKYKRRIITDQNGTLEYNTGSQSATITSLALRELSGLLIAGVGVRMIARA